MDDDHVHISHPTHTTTYIFDLKTGEYRPLLQPPSCSINSITMDSKQTDGDTKADPPQPTKFDVNSKLTATEQEQLGKLLEKNKDVIKETWEDPTVTNVLEHSIDLIPGSTPIKQRPYQYSPVETLAIRDTVNRLLKQGTIVPSQSPYSSPVVMVKDAAKEFGYRMCVDFRRLNAMTVVDSFPLPRTDTILREGMGSHYYSKMDCYLGFHQVPMKLEDRPKTAFCTRDGLYEYVTMPFGLINAPATYQRLMNIVTRQISPLHCLVYLDDIIIFSKTWNAHLKHLQEIFNAVRVRQLESQEIQVCFWIP